MIGADNKDLFMKRKLMIVGGGVIAAHYRKGLYASDTLIPVALVDVNPDCVARTCYDTLPFYTDCLTAVQEQSPDVALLSVPGQAREDVARDLLRRGIAVLTEKPMSNSLAKVEELLAFAANAGTPLNCMYHWAFADEVIFLHEHLADFGKTRSVRTLIHDDYAATADGSIRPDRLGLLGAWYDSGINVLSYYDRLFDLTNATPAGEEYTVDKKSGQPKYARRAFAIGDTQAEIIVDWTQPRRDKTSEFVTERGVLTVNHSTQTVALDGNTVFSAPTDDRLSSHYANLFAHLDVTRNTDQHTRMLHRILFA